MIIVLGCSLYTISVVHYLNQSYAVSLAGQLTEDSLVFDNRGIPFHEYGVVEGKRIGLQRNPLEIGEQAAVYHAELLRGNTDAKLKFMNCADWLLQHAVVRKDFAFYEYRYPWPPLYDLKPPWRSAMAQAPAIRALRWAYRMTGNKRYLILSKKLLKAFFVEIKDGGLTYKTKNGWWYEEYIGNTKRQPWVLNGMIYTVLRLHDVYLETQDPDSKFLVDQGVLALESNLAYYDGAGHSYYDKLKNYSKKYHRIHVELLDELYKMTGKDVFKRYADKWRNEWF